MIERIVRPDGEVRYLSSNGEVMMAADGNPVRMRGTCIDITERILAEQDRERTPSNGSVVWWSPRRTRSWCSTPAPRSLQANGRAEDLLGADPSGHAIGEILPAAAGPGGEGVEARSLSGEPTWCSTSRPQSSTESSRGGSDARCS